MDINAALATIDEEGEMEDSLEVSLLHTHVMFCFNLVSTNFYRHSSPTCNLLEIKTAFFICSKTCVSLTEPLHCRFTCVLSREVCVESAWSKLDGQEGDSFISDVMTSSTARK